MSNVIKKNKKIIIIMCIICLIPIAEPIIETFGECLFYIGKYLGTFVRNIMSNGVCI